MSTDYNTKKYEPFKIPSREELKASAPIPADGKEKGKLVSPDIQRFVEIVIGGANNAPKTEIIPEAAAPINEQAVDEKRAAFSKMKQLARETPSLRINQSNFYKPTLLNDMSKVFYKQAELMKDFNDDFNGNTSFNAYYPYYQLMNYEQLRTYFTWRTNVRNGVVKNTSLSYAYVYIYELLNNIGTSDPRGSLKALMDFRRAFLAHNDSIDKYLLKWIKDYHIYYDLADSYGAFITENSLAGLIPENEGCGTESQGVALFLNISKYDMRKSAFYTEENRGLIDGCMDYVINGLKTLFESKALNLEDFIFPLIKGKTEWNPFQRSLFYPRVKQRDRHVVFSEKEVYICLQGKWTYGPVNESGRQFIGYVIKQAESALRRAAGFKYKLSSKTGVLTPEHLKTLERAGILIDDAINGLCLEFYTSYNRKVISVDENTLEKIRLEALETQEKLIIQESEGETLSLNNQPVEECLSLISETESGHSDEWHVLKRSLTETEQNALKIIIQNGDIKGFSDLNGFMLEVLVDSINQKAYDAIGDTLLDFDNNVTVLEDYIEKLTETVMADG